MKTLTLFFVLLTSTISFCQAQSNNYSFKETYPVTAPAKITISTSDGNIDVIPTDGNEVQVFYVVSRGNKLQTISRAALEKELTLNIMVDKSSLSIQVKNKDQNSWSWNSNNRLEVGFILHVPRASACDLRTSDGNVSMKGLSANQQIHTSDGNIRISDLKGDVVGKTSDGNIVLQNITGQVDIRTSDGDIQLNNIAGKVQTSTSDGSIRMEKVKGDVAVRTSDGDISFNELSGSLLATTSDGNIRGRIARLQGELMLKTGDGNIDVVVPDRLGLDLNVKGGSLSVPLKDFSGRSDKKLIQGKVNGGGLAVNLSTSDGHIKLNFAE